MKPTVLRPLAADTTLPQLCAKHDGVVVVGPAPAMAPIAAFAPIAAAIERAVAVDATMARAHAPALLGVSEAPGGRVVVAATTPLAEETEDVRAIAEATFAAV